MKLRHQVMLAVTGITASVLSITLLGVYFLVLSDELRTLDRALLAQAHIIADQVERHGVEEVRETERSLDVPESFTRIKRYIAVYSPDGGPPLASRGFGGNPPNFSAFERLFRDLSPESGESVDLVIQGFELRGVLLPLATGDVLLHASSRQMVDDDLQYLHRLLPTTFAVAVLGTLLLSGVIGRVLTSDVSTIADVARRAARGDLDARVGPRARGSRETRLLANDLDEMLTRLTELVETQQAFISDAAHELRSPLATLRGELQLALRHPRSTQEYQRAIEEVLEDVDALVRLAEDLLTLARLRSEEVSEHGQASLDAIVGDALWMARGRALQRGVEFLRSPATLAPTTIRGDRTELARVLRNLLDNAVEHGPPGGKVHIECETHAHVLEVIVSDEGTGIPREDLPRAFLPFYRGATSRSGDHGGAGLGLSIARGLARRYGGDVFFQPTEKTAARVVLQIPRAPPSTSATK